MSLKNSAIKGVLWSALDSLAIHATQFIVIIILARLLTPHDFGLIAMIMVFVAVSTAIVKSGFSQALIREKKITEEEKATTFFTNFAFAIISYLILWFTAPLIASFYGEMELISLIRYMCLSLVFHSFSIVQSSTLQQELKFKHLALIQLPGVVLSGVVAIYLAYHDFGVYALASVYVFQSLFISIAFYLVNPWIPKTFIDSASFKKLFGFGSKIMLTDVLKSTFDNLYKVVIGKYFSSSSLGFYFQAKKIQNVPSQKINGIFQKVAYPILSKTKNDLEKLKNGREIVIKIISLVVFPIMVLLFTFTEDFILILLGEKWVEAAVYLKILCVSGSFYHVYSTNESVFKVLGNSNIVLKVETISKIFVILFIVIGINFGLIGIVIGEAIAFLLCTIVSIMYLAKCLEVGFIELSMDIIKLLLINIPMLLTIFILIALGINNLLSIIIGIMIYLYSVFIFEKEVFYMFKKYVLEIVNINTE